MLCLRCGAQVGKGARAALLRECRGGSVEDPLRRQEQGEAPPGMPELDCDFDGTLWDGLVIPAPPAPPDPGGAAAGAGAPPGLDGAAADAGGTGAAPRRGHGMDSPEGSGWEDEEEAEAGDETP